MGQSVNDVLKHELGFIGWCRERVGVKQSELRG
jgi:hypothetical protein